MDPAAPLSLEAYRALVGQEVLVGDWICVDQPMVDRFAELTGDRQFIHVDPERAARTPFGGTIAHAFLVLSLIGGVGVEALPRPAGMVFGLNYGFERVRFAAPVRTGKRVRPRFTLESVEERAPGQLISTLAVTIEIEGEDKPAVVADWLVLAVVRAGSTA
jgi:acyl dehydratase